MFRLVELVVTVAVATIVYHVTSAAFEIAADKLAEKIVGDDQSAAA